MTDITDQDRRAAREWAEYIAETSKYDDEITSETHAAVNYILATVDAPAPTPAEQLANSTRYWQTQIAATITAALDDLAANIRADQMEHDLAEARAEVELLTAERLDRNPETDARDKAALNNFDKAETVAVQKGAEINAETPDPADVKPGEAWVVEVEGERRHALKEGDSVFPWNTFNADGRHVYKRNENVTLITRLVPAPRVITNTDELERLAATSIIRDGRGWPGGVTDQGVTMINGFCVSDEDVLAHGPATVLWEPEA